MNFAFVGFGITGSVLSKDTNSGPSGIKVELLEKSKGDQEEVVKSALTGQDGSYVFFGVLPGVYNIRVSKEAQDLYSFEKTTQVRNGKWQHLLYILRLVFEVGLISSKSDQTRRKKSSIPRCIEKHGGKLFVSRTVLQIMIRENMNLFK